MVYSPQAVKGFLKPFQEILQYIGRSALSLVLVLNSGKWEVIRPLCRQLANTMNTEAPICLESSSCDVVSDSCASIGWLENNQLGKL